MSGTWLSNEPTSATWLSSEQSLTNALYASLWLLWAIALPRQEVVKPTWFLLSCKVYQFHLTSALILRIGGNKCSHYHETRIIPDVQLLTGNIQADYWWLDRVLKMNFIVLSKKVCPKIGIKIYRWLIWLLHSARKRWKIVQEKTVSD